MNKNTHFEIEESDIVLIIINGVGYYVGGHEGSFTWDIWGEEEHSFSEINEEIRRNAKGVYFKVVYKGVGSYLFDIIFLPNNEFAEFYKIISDLIDSAQKRGTDIIGYINQMSLDLDDSEILEDEIERQRLDAQINATYEILTERHYDYTSKMKKLVFNLQEYIEEIYGDVNNFIRESDFQVKSIFADISGTVGYPIDADNIEGNNS